MRVGRPLGERGRPLTVGFLVRRHTDILLRIMHVIASSDDEAYGVAFSQCDLVAAPAQHVEKLNSLLSNDIDHWVSFG